jgi:peroxiredoxin
MKRSFVLAVPVLTALFVSTLAGASEKARVDAQAPDFKLQDSKGTSHSLADFHGKWVVLEWVNFDCPFVRKHYRSGNMPALQRTYVGKGVVWLSVCSSAPGEQGHFEGKELLDRIVSEKSAATAYLVDAEGTVGKMYGAKTTPHMFVINPEGTLLYAGGIDDIASTDQDDLSRATNYVRSALDAAMAGGVVKVKESRPYGCSVKYR